MYCPAWHITWVNTAVLIDMFRIRKTYLMKANPLGRASWIYSLSSPHTWILIFQIQYNRYTFDFFVDLSLSSNVTSSNWKAWIGDLITAGKPRNKIHYAKLACRFQVGSRWNITNVVSCTRRFTCCYICTMQAFTWCCVPGPFTFFWTLKHWEWPGNKVMRECLCSLSSMLGTMLA